MKLSIYSLKKILFQGQARLLNCKTVMGEITVLPRHEKFIGVLVPGAMKVVEVSVAGSEDKEIFFNVKSGFLEVREGDEVRCIIEQ